MDPRVLTAEPAIADTAFVSNTACLIGDIEIGGRSSIWPFVCLRGDGGKTTVGDHTNVQEFSMLHGASIGNAVTIGHHVVIDYATVTDNSLIGIGSTILRGATVESDAMVAAGSVVRHDQTIPSGHLAYGTPAETRPLTDAQRDEIERIQEHYSEISQIYKSTDHFE